MRPHFFYLPKTFWRSRKGGRRVNVRPPPPPPIFSPTKQPLTEKSERKWKSLSFYYIGTCRFSSVSFSLFVLWLGACTRVSLCASQISKYGGSAKSEAVAVWCARNEMMEIKFYFEHHQFIKLSLMSSIFFFLYQCLFFFFSFFLALGKMLLYLKIGSVIYWFIIYSLVKLLFIMEPVIK